MEPIRRRHFLVLLGAALLLPPGKSPRAQTGEQTVPLPARDSLPDPLLYRMVDKRHPIESDEIRAAVTPHLESIPLQMDGILAANENVRVHSLCLADLESLFEASNQAQTGLYIHSGFRSYEEQAYAYSHAKDKTTVLLPGTSQHHTGLALDFTSSEIGKIIDLYSGFERTKAGIWLSEHAWEYGFLQSYIGNHDGIQNEPWHYLYVGRDLAKTYRALKSAGWYGDVFILQTAIRLGMDRIVLEASPDGNGNR